MRMAKAIMIMGTGSGAGKSVIAAGLCRIFRDMGIRVAPFKSQNMALNSFITRAGGEIGRAQAFQAEAAGIEPCNDINPVLLKATGEAGCQVILNGRVHATMKAEEYYAIKEEVWKEITAAYDRLAEEYDLIVIEGAGSPAEINLREEEVVNMRVARYANAPVVLVGDIDRGGVFASFYGTVELLKESFSCSGRLDNGARPDADYIKAFIVNKFRGEMNILRPGLRMIEEKAGRPVIGTLYFQPDLGLDEEDGLSIEGLKRLGQPGDHKTLKIVVLRLKYIANFTDFAPFLYEPDVEIKYSLWEEDINSADLIILPGSKNTVADLMLLRESGLEQAVKSAVKRGIPLAGICGGYQMLGQKILDPHCVESPMAEVEGMGLLDTITTLDRTKTTCQVRAGISETGMLRSGDGGGALFYGLAGSHCHELKGYEIHMGRTTGEVGLFSISRFPVSPDNSGRPLPDGSAKGNVWGTYIHGIFDNDGLRTALLNSLRTRKGLPPLVPRFNYEAKRDEAINKWAAILKTSIDICFVLRQVGMDYCMKKLPEDLR